jgi:hypothetical protein
MLLVRPSTNKAKKINQQGKKINEQGKNIKKMYNMFTG